MSDAFWDTIRPVTGTNEGDVETQLIVPLLEALGHQRDCIRSKVKVLFQQGTKKTRGRKPEADFVVYAEEPFGRATSLIVVEAKRPDERLEDARDQGESYAQNLRTPLLLLTNGIRLEVWQIQLSTDSEKVFAADVSDLASKRGELESVLGKEAAKAHCASLAYKRFDLLARDLSGYELGEHRRIQHTYGSPIGRTLLDDAEKPQASTSLLDLFPRGGVVIGMSGYGKTTLAASLILEGFERRWEGRLEVLPVDVFLPDVVFSGHTLEEFLAKRIEARKPGFTKASLVAIARESGLLIVADGYERVSAELRGRLEGYLRTFLRDYDKVRVFVMSRESAAPTELGLPILQLHGYSRDQLIELAHRAATSSPTLEGVFDAAPAYVYPIAEVPLFADLILRHYERSARYVTDLASLYEEWLGRILSGPDPIQRALDRNLLEAIAAETVAGPIEIRHASKLGGNLGSAETALSRLAAADAISVRGSTIELRHEGLSDYLRASTYWKGAASTRKPLAAFNFDPSSQFSTLLVATAPNSDDRGSAWQTIARTDLQLAIRALHLLVGEAVVGDGDHRKPASDLLDDIRLTIDILTSCHLDPIKDLVFQEIAGVPIMNLGIRGGAGPGGVNFSFFERGQRPEVEIDAATPTDRKFYGNSLRRLAYGREVGRVLGAKRVESALQNLVDHRQLPGGTIWTEERVFGRLRHLAEEYGAPVNADSLVDAREVLLPDANAIVGQGLLNSGQTFFIRDVLEDIDRLIQAGSSGVPRWWGNLDELDVRTTDGQKALSAALDRYYYRIQRAYAEVVERSFPRLGNYLRTYRMMPLRIEAEAHYRELMPGRASIMYRYRPVRDYDEAGADLTYPKEVSAYPRTQEEIDSYFEKTRALLKQFGRPVDNVTAVWGVRGVPDFSGQIPGHGDMLHESAVVRGAMDWLRTDLRALFSEMPADASPTV